MRKEDTFQTIIGIRIRNEIGGSENFLEPCLGSFKGTIFEVKTCWSSWTCLNLSRGWKAWMHAQWMRREASARNEPEEKLWLVFVFFTSSLSASVAVTRSFCFIPFSPDWDDTVRINEVKETSTKSWVGGGWQVTDPSPEKWKKRIEKRRGNNAVWIPLLRKLPESAVSSATVLKPIRAIQQFQHKHA